MNLIVKELLKFLKSYIKELIFIIFCILLGMFIAYMHPIIIQKIMDEGMVKRNYNIVCIFSLLLIIFIIINQLLEIGQNINLFKVRQNIISELSIQAFDKLLHMKIDFFENQSSAEIIEQLNTDINSLGILLNQGFIYMFSFSMKIFPGIIGLVYINWKMAICIICSIPIKLIILHIISHREEEVTSDLIAKKAKLYALLDDIIKGIREVKLLNIYSKEMEKFKNKKEIKQELERKHNMLGVYNIMLENILQGIMLGIFYLYGGYCVCNGKMSVGNVLAFISYSNYVTGPISMIMDIKIVIAQIKPSFKRLNDFFEQPSEKEKGYKFPEKFETLYVDHLEFGYNKNIVLKDISFKVKKGEKIAIIGENGSGKSSFIYILLRLYELQKGQIFVDSDNIRNIDLKEYHTQFSVVSQFPYFFRETVRENLDPNRKYSDQEILDVFKKLKMMDVYNALQHGLDTKIGIDSANLSGGERQKLALIRAVLQNSPIFILDECTSNYDVQSEKWLYTQGLGILQDKILICVTHKYQYLKNFDRVYLLSKGMISTVEV